MAAIVERIRAGLQVTSMWKSPKQNRLLTLFCKSAYLSLANCQSSISESNKLYTRCCNIQTAVSLKFYHHFVHLQTRFVCGQVMYGFSDSVGYNRIFTHLVSMSSKYKVYILTIGSKGRVVVSAVCKIAEMREGYDEVYSAVFQTVGVIITPLDRILIFYGSEVGLQYKTFG